MVLDLHMQLSLRNSSPMRVRGVTLLVTAQEVTPGGKASVAVPSLSVAPGEMFPVRIDLRTEWMYSDPRPDRRGDECVCCPGRHAFSRGGHVVRSDVPSPYSTQQDVASHLWRAISAFGDDRDLVIEVRTRDTEVK